jgi:two-component system, OmpR family, phosphate regulon response regulator PhoB
MKRLLVVDDDDAVRRLIRLNLTDGFDVIDTAAPEQAFALALEHKPDAILLDLRMPRYSGLQLCQSFSSFDATQLIPIVVISGESGARTKELCRDLGAVAYFEKPIDFAALRLRLDVLLEGRRKERRLETRVRLRVAIGLSGTDQLGERFDVVTKTENVGRNSFLCVCGVALSEGSRINVQALLASDEKASLGQAQVIRSEWKDTHYPRYACRFTGKTTNWVLQ